MKMQQVWFRSPPTDLTKARRRAKRDKVSLPNVLRMLMAEYADGKIKLDDSAFRRILSTGGK